MGLGGLEDMEETSLLDTDGRDTHDLTGNGQRAQVLNGSAPDEVLELSEVDTDLPPSLTKAGSS